MKRTAAITVALLITATMLTACGGDEDSSASSSSSSSSETTEPETTEPRTMSEVQAFCDLLESGWTPREIFGKGLVDRLFTAEEAAEQAYWDATLLCPEQLKTNKALRAFLVTNGIDPDA